MNEKRATPSFSILTHANGTKTLVDSENHQAMHSQVGPVDEANAVYAALAKIEERLCSPDSVIRLYDVGMGTAANVLATFERILKCETASGALHVYSFELKPEGLRAALKATEDFSWLAPWRDTLLTLLNQGEARCSLGKVDVHWRLFVGDFYTTFHPLPAPDFIYFDFYSPRIVPELWSLDKFQSLRDHISEKACRFFTYSAATPTRLNLLLAGFFVGRGGTTPLKNETTQAAVHYTDLESPLDAEWLRHKLKTSTRVTESTSLEKLLAHPQWGL